MGFFKTLGRKTHKAANKFAKTADKGAKFVKSASHVARDVGKVAEVVGAATGQPEIIAGGAALRAAGKVGGKGVKAYRSIRKGDHEGAMKAAHSAHHSHSHFR